MWKWDITPDYALNILKVKVLLCHLAAILDSGPPMVQDGRQKIFGNSFPKNSLWQE